MNSRWYFDMRFHSLETDKRNRKDTKYIVIHTMAEYLDIDGSIMHAYDFLVNSDLFPHYLVTPSGVAMHMLSNNLIGAHARGHNSESVGIEVLIPGCLTYQMFTKATMEEYVSPAAWKTLVQLVRKLRKEFPEAEIVGHHDLDPHRKIDPGKYVDLRRLRDETV